MPSHFPASRARFIAGPWRAVPESGPTEARVGTVGTEVQVTFVGDGARVFLRPAAAGSEAPTLYTVLDGEARTLTPVERTGRMVLDFGRLAHGEHMLIQRGSHSREERDDGEELGRSRLAR